MRINWSHGYCFLLESPWQQKRICQDNEELFIKFQPEWVASQVSFLKRPDHPPFPLVCFLTVVHPTFHSLAFKCNFSCGQCKIIGAKRIYIIARASRLYEE